MCWLDKTVILLNMIKILSFLLIMRSPQHSQKRSSKICGHLFSSSGLCGTGNGVGLGFSLFTLLSMVMIMNYLKVCHVIWNCILNQAQGQCGNNDRHIIMISIDLPFGHSANGRTSYFESYSCRLAWTIQLKAPMDYVSMMCERDELLTSSQGPDL